VKKTHSIFKLSAFCLLLIKSIEILFNINIKRIEVIIKLNEKLLLLLVELLIKPNEPKSTAKQLLIHRIYKFNDF